METTKENLSINTILYTKDGRKIGNSIIISQRIHEGFNKTLYKVKTDYGNTTEITHEEIENRFYIGEVATDREEGREAHKHSV